VIQLLISIVLAYLIGSLPTASIIVSIMTGRNIKQIGSGNAGGTNVSRVLGWGWGSLVILLDALKGILAAGIALTYFAGDSSEVILPGIAIILTADEIALLCGVAAIIGHIYSIFSRFNGGKGVATAAGCLLLLFPMSYCITLPVFVITVIISRKISLASMLATLSLIPATIIFYQSQGFSLLFAVFLSLLLLWTHRDNIFRIINSAENQIGS
jgi:acyl phosphate:glycerol-3-phosphate acyltransferase